MHVLIADGIIIVVMIMIGIMTEAIAEKANKDLTTFPQIKEGMIGIVEIKEVAIQKTGDTQMTGITSPQTLATETDSEMIATGNMIAPMEGTDSNVQH
jgi:hypothetical protein